MGDRRARSRPEQRGQFDPKQSPVVPHLNLGSQPWPQGKSTQPLLTPLLGEQSQAPRTRSAPGQQGCGCATDGHQVAQESAEPLRWARVCSLATPGLQPLWQVMQREEEGQDLQWAQGQLGACLPSTAEALWPAESQVSKGEARVQAMARRAAEGWDQPAGVEPWGCRGRAGCRASRGPGRPGTKRRARPGKGRPGAGLSLPGTGRQERSGTGGQEGLILGSGAHPTGPQWLGRGSPEPPLQPVDVARRPPAAWARVSRGGRSSPGWMISLLNKPILALSFPLRLVT